MSKVDTAWGLLEEEGIESYRDFFEEKYGPLYSNGCNIGREVQSKIEDFKRGNASWSEDYVKPTLLQAEGLDNGLTAGFLTGVGIHVDGTETREEIIEIGCEALNHHGADISISILNDVVDLPDEYREEYGNYHTEQGWHYPAIFIEYVPLVSLAS